MLGLALAFVAGACLGMFLLAVLHAAGSDRD